MKKGMSIFLVGLGVTIVIAGALSQLASGQPDGLEFVAEQEGFLETAEDHALSDSPLADYGGESRTRLTIAGIVGALATLGLGYVVFKVAKAKDAPERS